MGGLLCKIDMQVSLLWLANCNTILKLGLFTQVCNMRQKWSGYLGLDGEFHPVWAALPNKTALRCATGCSRTPQLSYHSYSFQDATAGRQVFGATVSLFVMSYPLIIYCPALVSML